MKEPCPWGTRALVADSGCRRQPFDPRVGVGRAAGRPRCVSEERQAEPGGTPHSLARPEVNLPHPWAQRRPSSSPPPKLQVRRGRACGGGWGVGQSDGFLLRLDSQDSGLPNLSTSQKQLTEAPLQAGMVKLGGCEAPRGLQLPTCSARIFAVPPDWVVLVQAELYFPACTAHGRRSRRKDLRRLLPPPSGGRRAVPFCRWRHRGLGLL